MIYLIPGENIKKTKLLKIKIKIEHANVFLGKIN